MASDKFKYHALLAEYFSGKTLYLDENVEKKPNVRKLVELSWQQIKAEMWDEATRTSCDIFFIEARAKSDFLDLQQAEYQLLISLEPGQENKKCLIAFFKIFIQQKHILADYPELTFQQLYNELQWTSGVINNFLENSRNEFLKRGRSFLHQYRIPEMIESRLLMTLTGYSSDSVMSCAYSPDGTKIVSGNFDSIVTIWDAENGREINTLFGHDFLVLCCAFSSDGKRIVSGGFDRTLIIWDTDTGEKISKLSGHDDIVSSCAFSPDGKWIISGSYDHTLKLWEAESYKEILHIRGHKAEVNSCKFSPDGEFILSGSNDKTIRIWDSKTGKELKCLRGHNDNVNSCSYSLNGEMIISGSKDQTLKLWSAVTGEEIRSFIGHTGEVECCMFSPDGNQIVSGSTDRTLKIWDVGSGKVIANLTGHSVEVTSCDFSPDGERIVSGSSDHTLKIWDSKAGTEIPGLPGHSKRVFACNFSSDGKFVVTAGNDNVIKLWDTESGKHVFNLPCEDLTCCALSPEGLQILKGSSTTPLEIWDTKSGNQSDVFTGFDEVATKCAFSPDGSQFVSVSSDNSIKLRNLVDGKVIMTAKSHDDISRCCAFSPDGKLIAAGSSELTVWDTDTGKEKAILNRGSGLLESCSFSADGKRIATVHYDHTLNLWNAETIEEVASLNSYGDRIRSCGFSAGTNRFVTGSNVKTLSLWDSEYGNKLALIVFDAEIHACAISGDGEKIACGDYAGNFYLFELIGFDPCVPVITPVRLWHYPSGTKNGYWDTDIRALCTFCGLRFSLDELNVATPQDQLNLTVCPNCSSRLKINPFVVDNKEKTENGILTHKENKSRNHYDSQMNEVKNDFKNRDEKYQLIYTNAENAFNEKKWETAFNLYLNLVQQGKFDINLLRYKMIICKINCLTTYNTSVIGDIKNLIELLQKNGAEDYARMAIDNLNERLSRIPPEDLKKAHPGKPWWKKMF